MPKRKRTHKIKRVQSRKKRTAKHRNIKRVASRKVRRVNKQGGAVLPFTPNNEHELEIAVYKFTKKSDMEQNIAEYGKMDTWITTNIKSMTRLFQTFVFDNVNDIISNWDVSNVTNMSGMFENSTHFNQPLNSWQVSKLQFAHSMFKNCDEFNSPLDQWNVSNVTTMTSMFAGCKAFNQSLNSWNVSKVNNMNYMFHSCVLLNQPFDNWNIRITTDIDKMFLSCDSLRQIIPWDKDNVTQCPNCISKDAEELTAYYAKRDEQKQIHDQIKTASYSMPEVPEPSIPEEYKGWNPALQSYVDIREWIAEDETNFIIINGTNNYCVSKSWISKSINQYRVVQCDPTRSTPLQPKLHPEIESIMKRSSVLTLKRTTFDQYAYINLNIFGIEPACIVPYQNIKEITTSITKKYNLMDTSHKIMVTLESNMLYNNYKKTKENQNTIHKAKSLIKIDDYENPLASVIRDHTHQWDQRINAYLNSNKTDEEYLLDPWFIQKFNENPYASSKEDAIAKLKKKIAQLDELFIDYSHTSSEEFVVYRGIKSDRRQVKFGVNKAFVSTTTDMDVALDFIDAEPCCLLEITISPGVPFLSAKKFSHYAAEEEIVLPRGLVYTYSHSKDTLHHYVTASLRDVNQFYQGWNCKSYPIYNLIPVE